ncbi:MAG: 16S rRNA (cytosine(967)-C(5))-methyltransferase RsmB [Calditrichia bacterium]
MEPKEPSLSQENNSSQVEISPEQIQVRQKIMDVLDRIDTRYAYSDKLLANELNDLSDLDKKLATEIIHGVMRWREKLDWYIIQLYNGDFESLLQSVKSILRAALYQLIFLDKVPAYAVLNESVELAKKKFNQRTANLVNAILRNYLRQDKKLEWMLTQLDILEKYSIQLSHPKWLIQRWIEYWGIDEVEKLCLANNQVPDIFVKRNTLKVDKQEFESLLDSKDIEYEADSILPNFYKISNFQKFKNSHLLEEGYAFVQDPSAALPVILLQPEANNLVWDMCAAPGAKSVHLGLLTEDKAKIIASDIYLNRVILIKKISKNLGLKKIYPIVGDSISLEFKEQFDKILLDAPCSGFGVLRKRTDLRWKKTEKDIADLNNLQYRLLEKAARALKSGGELVYSTCTIELAENDLVIDQFLNHHQEFSVLPAGNRLDKKWVDEKGFVRTFPHRHQIDGSFAVLLKKS